MPPRKPQPFSVQPSPAEGTSGWDGQNYKDGFHIDASLSDEQRQRNIGGAQAAKAAIRGTFEEQTVAETSAVSISPSVFDVQDVLVEASPTPVRFDPKRRRAFGSVPNLLGANLTVQPMTKEGRELADPDQLRGLLYSPNAPHSVSGIALNPQEYELIVRSPVAFETSIGNKTIIARALSRQLQKYRAGLSSQKQALESKGPKHNTIIESLSKESAALRKLRKYAFSPGYALTDETDIRILATEAWGSFLNLLHVAGSEAGWPADQTHAAENALAVQLVKGEQRQRVHYWQEMLSLTDDYTRNKIVLFKQRRNTIRSDWKRINKHLMAIDDALLSHQDTDVKAQ